LPPESLRMRMLRAKQNKEDPADVMSNSSVSTEETTGWTQVSDKIDSCTVESEAKLANPMMVPAGVDTGMLLERQLRETDDDNQSVGPKKIQRDNFTVTVKSANVSVTVSVDGSMKTGEDAQSSERGTLRSGSEN